MNDREAKGVGRDRVQHTVSRLRLRARQSKN
jgi:hypothetical protein